MKHLGEEVSAECEQSIKKSLEYLNSDACKRYNAIRDAGIGGRPMTLEEIKASARGGLEKLRKNGSTLIRIMHNERSRAVAELEKQKK